MAVMIQIRNVPDAIHRKLKARAARAGLSMSDYLLEGIRRDLERPTRDEVLTRLAKRTPVEPQPAASELVRSERDRR